MAAPYPRLRKYLPAPSLLKTICQSFEAIVDHRAERSQISLPDALMSGLAVFGLKYPLLLKFDEAYQNEAVVRHNLRTLLRVERAPCDTQLRTTLASVRHWTQSPVHSLSNPDIKDSSVPKTLVFEHTAASHCCHAFSAKRDMPVSFLTPAQRERYGRCPASLSADELARYFYPGDDEWEWISQKRREATRLGIWYELFR